jgi:hypothetical protein
MSVVMLTTDFQEAAMMKFASEQLKLVRTYSPFGGDPFTGATMHAMVRRTLKGLAEVHERNMARIVDLALSGAVAAYGWIGRTRSPGRTLRAVSNHTYTLLGSSTFRYCIKEQLIHCRQRG